MGTPAKRADQRKYHYIYKITRTDGSGKYYIGMHSTDDLDDGYFGSGKVLWHSINRHGKEIHSKEILEFLPTRKELKARERELVNEEILDDPLCMNLCLGGEGGFDTLNAKGQNLYGKNGKFGFGGQNLVHGRTSEAHKKRWSLYREEMLVTARKAQVLATIAAKSQAAIDKRQNTYIERGHQQGEKNSQFGTCWVTNGTPIKIKKEELDAYLANGYRRGRK